MTHPLAAPAPAPVPASPDPAAADAHAAYRALARFSCLDGLRFLSIAAVLWHHAPLRGALPDTLPDGLEAILGRGFLGVDFFFVLSGYLVTTLFLREEARTGRFSLRGFYWRRLLRIVPVHYFVVTLVGVWYILIRGDTGQAVLLPHYYLFLSNFLVTDIPLLAPTWSLAVEVQYYLVWPLVLLALPRRALMPVLGLLIAVNVLGIMGAFAPFGITATAWGPLVFRLPNSTYAPILIGSALAIVLHDARGFARVWPVLGARQAPPLAFAALLAVVALAPSDLRGLPNLVIHLVMAACLATLVMRDRNVLTPVMAWRPFARLGEVSYGLYLYHLLALAIVMRALPGLSPAWVFVVYSAVAIAMAEASDRTLERFFRRFRG